jgi:hypothetical protein
LFCSPEAGNETWRNRRVEASQCFIAVNVDNIVDYLIFVHEKNSNRKEFQEYFVGSEGSWCIGLTTWPP